RALCGRRRAGRRTIEIGHTHSLRRVKFVISYNKQEETMTTRTLCGALLLSCLPAFAWAQAPSVKIGVLTAQSTFYSDTQRIGSVIAAKFAVDDYAAKLGVKAEVVSADHQNKVDIGATIARNWYDVQGVDVIMDLPNSAVALAVNILARDLNKVLIGSG